MGVECGVAEAKRRWSELIRAVEAGERVVITRRRRPVAQLVPLSVVKRQVQLGSMRDRIKLYPGWDDPITEDELIGEGL